MECLFSGLTDGYKKFRLSVYFWFIFSLVLPLSMSWAVEDNYQWDAIPTEQHQEQLTIKAAILSAFSRSPQVNQAAAQIEVGEGNLEGAKSAWLPQISLQAGSGRSHQTNSSSNNNNYFSSGTNLKQLLYDFGRTNSNIDQKDDLKKSYIFQFRSTLNSVGLQTLQAYLQVKRYQDLMAVTQQNIISLQGIKDMANLRAQAGLSTQSDRLQAEARIASMQATHELYRAQMQSAQAVLTALTGIVPKVLAELPTALLEQKMTLQGISFQDNNAILGAQARQLATEKAIDLVKSQHWPTLSLQAGSTRYLNSHNPYWSNEVQLMVEAPLYQGGAVNAQIRAAEGQRRAARAEVEASKLEVNQRASIAYADLIGARQRQQAERQQQVIAEKARDIYRDEYRLGKRSLNDLLSVEQDVFQAQSAKIVSHYDAWEACARYAGAVDNLLSMLGIDQGNKQENE